MNAQTSNTLSDINRYLGVEFSVATPTFDQPGLALAVKRAIETLNERLFDRDVEIRKLKQENQVLTNKLTLINELVESLM